MRPNQTTSADKIWQPREYECLDVSGKDMSVKAPSPENTDRKAEIHVDFKNKKPEMFQSSLLSQVEISANGKNGNNIKKSMEELLDLWENKQFLEIKDRLTNMSLLELEKYLDFIISKVDEQTEGENYILFYVVQEIGNRGTEVFSGMGSCDEWTKVIKIITNIGNYFFKKMGNEDSEEIRGKICETLGKISPALVRCLNLKFVNNGKTSYPPLSMLEVLIIGVFYRTLQNGAESEPIHSHSIEAIKKICFSPVDGTNLVLALLKLQQSGEEEIRNKAKTLLDNITAIFKIALKDENAKVRRTAARSLGIFGSYGSLYTDDIVSNLIDTLDDPKEEVTNEVVSALVKIGPPALLHIVDITRNYGGDKIKLSTIKILGIMGKQGYADGIKEEALKTLVGVIQYKYAPTDNKIAAAEAIVLWGNKAEKISVPDENENSSTVFNELKAAFLNTEDSDLTSKIGHALFKLNSNRALHFFKYALALSPQSEKDVVKKGKITKARRASVFVMGKAGEKAKSEYKMLIPLLEDEDYTLRLCVVEALGSIGRYLSGGEKQEVINALVNIRKKLYERNNRYNGLFIGVEEKKKNNNMISAIKRALSRVERGNVKPEPPELRPR